MQIDALKFEYLIAQKRNFVLIKIYAYNGKDLGIKQAIVIKKRINIPSK